ncbi:hypothetical protein B0T14DRAFT_565477 [Immersiella caudata]|uniref:S-protein homolog n=1 Tax=Immersiella caudata TaxID=314043 RepID=A0AA40C486_9PEZI|nr:hypothetical protein B0T14DRAFT_565477 [Immersiella caudata]
MNLFLCLAALISLLLAPVAAENFWIWNTFIDGDDRPIGGQKYMFLHEHEVPPKDCHQILTAQELYPLSTDASSDWVCTCDGPGCTWYERDPWQIDRFEWHASWGHFTWYKNRDMKFYDQVNREWGTCTPSPPNDWRFYWNWGGEAEWVRVVRLMEGEEWVADISSP